MSVTKDCPGAYYSLMGFFNPAEIIFHDLHSKKKDGIYLVRDRTALIRVNNARCTRIQMASRDITSSAVRKCTYEYLSSMQ